MGRAVFCIIFNGAFDFTNDIAWGGPDMLGIREIWAILWGQFCMFGIILSAFALPKLFCPNFPRHEVLKF